MGASDPDLAERRAWATRAVEALTAAAARLDALDVGARDGAARLRQLATRTAADRFRVVFVGGFSTGKSTLLNALLEGPWLPARVSPTTAVPTEMHWGEAPRLTLVQRDGADVALPVEALRDTLALHAHDAREATAELSDRFDDAAYARLELPAPLLRDGVVLVDTPGLDDDPARTARTLAALPDADAAVVVLHATRFLTLGERALLEEQLAPLGLRQLFFVTTMVDLLARLSDDPQAEHAALDRRAQAALGPLVAPTPLSDRFFLVDSRGALEAARAGEDPTPTGIPALRARLIRYLADERGPARERALRDAVDAVARRLDADIALQVAAADAAPEALARRLAAVAPRFEELDRLARQVGATLDVFLAAQQDAAAADLARFLAELETGLPAALEAVDLGAVPSLSLLRPGGRETLAEALRAGLEAHVDAAARAWRLAARARLERSLTRLADELRPVAEDFDATVARILEAITGAPMPRPAAPADEGPPALERWLSLAVGALLLSPGTVAAGLTDGWEGVARGAASRLGTRLALVTLGALSGPVGWAGLALMAAVDAVLVVTSGERHLDRLRSRLAARFHERVVEATPGLDAEVRRQVREALTPLREAVVAAARTEAATWRRTVDELGTQREDAAAAAQELSGRASEARQVLAMLRASLK